MNSSFKGSKHRLKRLLCPFSPTLFQPDKQHACFCRHFPGRMAVNTPKPSSLVPLSHTVSSAGSLTASSQILLADSIRQGTNTDRLLQRHRASPRALVDGESRGSGSQEDSRGLTHHAAWSVRKYMPGVGQIFNCRNFSHHEKKYAVM